MLQNITSNIS